MEHSVEESWIKFIEALKKEDASLLENINPPASSQLQEEAEKIFGKLWHDDLKKLYSLANGFKENSFLLRDDYRILPLEELIKETKISVGVPADLPFEEKHLKKIKRLIFILAKEEDYDVEKISVSVTKSKTNIQIWYKEGGIHDFEEVVNTQETLGEWLHTVVSEYYS